MLGDHEALGVVRDPRHLEPHHGRRVAVPSPAYQDYGNPWDNEWSKEEGIDLARYWHMVFKHRWVVLASLVGALAIGLAVTLLTTPIYEAASTIKIDREVGRIVNVEGIEPRDSSSSSEEFFQTQYGVLKSRSLAMNVVDRLNLASSDDFFKAMGSQAPQVSGGNALAARRAAAVGLFQANMAVSPVRGSRLVRISFASPNPAVAAAIANATAEEFITSNLTRRYESSDYARQFLEGKLRETKAALDASQQLAADYASREKLINVAPTTENNTASLGTQSLAVTSLVAVNANLSAARAERIKAEERYRQSMTAAAASLPEVLDNPTIQELSQTRSKLEAEYGEKSKVYKPDFPDMQALRAQIDQLDRQIEQQMANIQASLKVAYAVTLNQERAFEGQVNKAQGATLDMGQRSIQYNILQREADTNRILYDGLLQRYKEIGVAGGISTNNISIVDRAEVPGGPSKPRPMLNMILAGMAGLGLGVLLALLLEALDESISTPEDIEAKLGLPLLGSVPKLAKGEAPLEELASTRSAFSEAYYSIRTALQFSTAQGAPSSLLVTSSRPSEGKSTTALAISQNFARIGLNVLLVDGDMRNPSMHRLMGVQNNKGLSNLLVGDMTVGETVVPTETPNLSFIPCGPLPPNPAELLAGPGLKTFLNDALRTYSMVVIDGPPVLGLADAPTLAASIAGTVFVVESRGTRRGLGKAAVRRLQTGHAHILGGVLTKFDAKKASYGQGYGYAYSYEYGSKPKLDAPS